MLVLLSPSKTLDTAPTPYSGKTTHPEFLPQASELAGMLGKKSRPQLAKLMAISPKLAEQVAGYYQNWKTPFTEKNAHPALLTFRGDVYEGLAAEDFNAADRNFAQQHLRILSGLYGVLRPLDRMQPYRLEMGCRLASGGTSGSSCRKGNRPPCFFEYFLGGCARKHSAGNPCTKVHDPRGLAAGEGNFN